MFYDNYIVKVTDFFIQKNLPIYTNILPQQELNSYAATTGLSSQQKKKCPKCGGTGKMDSTDHPLGVLAAIFTLGASVLAVGEIKCDECDGKGEVST